MKQQQITEAELKQTTLSEYDRLKMSLDKNSLRLSFLETEKDELYESTDFDIERLQVLNDEIDRTSGAITKIKSSLQKFGFNQVENSQTLDDNQTIISTSSVRRKSAIALEILNDEDLEIQKRK